VRQQAEGEETLHSPNSPIAATGLARELRVVWDEVSNFNCNCDLLICGFDKEGRPLMHSLDNPGATSCLDHIGLHAIGSGWTFALSRLLWNEINAEHPLEQVLYNVFDAKATAEIVQGVGYEWDAVILTANSATDVPKRIKDIIEKLFIRATLDPFDMKMDAEDVPPQNWKSQFRKFTESIVPPDPKPTVVNESHYGFTGHLQVLPKRV